MLQFNELRLTEDCRCLIIDAQVEDQEAFEDVTIKEVYVDTDKTWETSGPSAKAVKVYSTTLTTLDKIEDPDHRHIRLEVTSPVMELSAERMYFVYVVADVSEAENLTTSSSSCDDKLMGVTYSTYKLYTILLYGLKEILVDCSAHRKLIDDFLRQEALDISLKTGNYTLAIKFWTKFFSGKRTYITHKTCGCNG